MNGGQRWNRNRFLTRFAFGFVLGSGFGYLVGARAADMGITTIAPPWLLAVTIPGCGILFGIIAWWFSDDYWDT